VIHNHLRGITTCLGVWRHFADGVKRLTFINKAIHTRTHARTHRAQINNLTIYQSDFQSSLRTSLANLSSTTSGTHQKNCNTIQPRSWRWWWRREIVNSMVDHRNSRLPRQSSAIMRACTRACSRSLCPLLSNTDPGTVVDPFNRQWTSISGSLYVSLFVCMYVCFCVYFHVRHLFSGLVVS